MEKEDPHSPMRPNVTTSKTLKLEAFGLGLGAGGGQWGKKWHGCCRAKHWIDPRCLDSNPDSSLTSWVTLGKLLHLSVLSFLTCKTGIITVVTI